LRLFGQLLFSLVGLQTPSSFVSSARTFALGLDRRYRVIFAVLHQAHRQLHRIHEQPRSPKATTDKTHDRYIFIRHSLSKFRLHSCQGFGKFLVFALTSKGVSTLSLALQAISLPVE